MAKLFDVGAQYPDQDSVERIAKYYRMESFFDGDMRHVYDRVAELLKGTPYAEQLNKLLIAVNLADIIVKKPADLIFGEKALYETGTGDDTNEQKALSRIVEENNINLLGHEVVVGAGIRGDAFLKTYYNVRNDYSVLEEEGLPIPDSYPEPIIEAVHPANVFPILSKGSRKDFKEIDVTWVEWVETPASKIERLAGSDKVIEVPYLNVERHLPGYIIYERYRMSDIGVDNQHGYPVSLFRIEERVPTGKDEDVIATGVPEILIRHIPYFSKDTDWKGVGGIEKIESLITAINDRIMQIDYILFKHSDPVSYGPDLEAKGDSVSLAGKYISLNQQDVTPGYATWDGKLDAAFSELDFLLSMVFMLSETPPWVFGVSPIKEGNSTGGTSHTDGSSLLVRLMPLLSKVNRIRTYVDRSMRDALWLAQELEVAANEHVPDFVKYTPVYPVITFRDGIPIDEKREAEIAAIRTGDKPTMSVLDAIKRLDEVGEAEAKARIKRIDEDEARILAATATVDGSIYGEGNGEES